MAVETFETVNSVYEVDMEKMKVRRVSGDNPPTGRFEEDGKWHKFANVTTGWHGGLVFWWPDATCTVTSMPKSKFEALDEHAK